MQEAVTVVQATRWWLVQLGLMLAEVIKKRGIGWAIFLKRNDLYLLMDWVRKRKGSRMI